LAGEAFAGEAFAGDPFAGETFEGGPRDAMMAENPAGGLGH